MYLALLLFFLTYVLMIVFSRKRPLIAVSAAVLFVLLGILPVSKVVDAIDWNVLMMLAGTMGTVGLFIESKMPNRMADYLLQRCPNVRWVIVVMSLFAGIVSAFVDNVATVLMIAPVGLAIAKKLDISPVGMLISISVSSNLQGAATLVGDTTSILLGGYANMDFMDFFFLNGKISIFWAVELGALATIPVILFLFRKDKAAVQAGEMTEVTDFFPTVLLLSNVLLLIAASFLPSKPALTNGLICLGLCLIGVLRLLLKGGDRSFTWKILREIDYATLFLLAGLFVVIEGINEAGVIAAVSKWFVRAGGDNLFLMYTLIVWGSVLLSAFIDNIPYVATMLPVISGIASLMGCEPYVLYFGLLTGSTLGGNLTPIGASANIATIGILQKNGYTVPTKAFLRIGVPFTLTAVLCGYFYCWFVWA
ncbi:MAG: SLC13 family permease [Oscillospiraceae bacterium]|jgi:Na+/H+ antiporter NhaD/arsenite permease-like protein